MLSTLKLDVKLLVVISMLFACLVGVLAQGYIVPSAACADNPCNTLYSSSHPSCPGSGRCNYKGSNQPLICYLNPDAECGVSAQNEANGLTEVCEGDCAVGGAPCTGRWHRCSTTIWY